jgi:pilus assembly protein CpaE
MNLSQLRILLVLGDDVDGGVVRHALPPGADLRTSNIRESLDRTSELLGEVEPDVVLVGCAAYSEASLEAVRKIAARRRECPVVVLYQGSPNGFVARAFDAGADDLIVLPQAPDHVAFALEKVIARRRGTVTPELAPMIVVLGPKGGTGKTLTSCNLAVALAEKGARPVVVDLDLQFGDVGLALGMRPERTIYDLARSGSSLDADKVDGFVTEHPSGASALLAPLRPDHAAAVEVGFLRDLFGVLRSRYDYVIVDSPPLFSPEVIVAVDSASHLCMVGMLDALSLKDTKIGLETLEQMGYDPDGVTLVLNRADSSVGITQKDVAELLGRSPDLLVPSDRAIPRMITHGRTIVEGEPRSGAAKAFRALADRYANEAELSRGTAADPADRRGLRRALTRKAA